MSERLPFLVVHGDWFWIAWVVLGSALTLGAIYQSSRFVRLRFARRRRGETLAWLRQHCARSLVEGPITVAGRWEGDALDVNDTRIAMGEWRGASPSDTKFSRGETVLVTGELHRGPPEQEASSWWFVGAMCYRDDPQVPPEPAKRSTLLSFAVGSVLVVYVGLRVLGAHLVDGALHREYLPGNGGPLIITNAQALSLAASLPGSRDDALDALAWALRRHPYRDDASVERQRELARLQDGPCAATGFLSPSGRYDEELELARKCGHRRDVFALDLAKGDFARAWEDRPPKLDWPFGVGMIAIARGDWKSAADAAEDLAKFYDHEGLKREAEVRQALHSSLEERERAGLGAVKDAAHRARCMAKWFRVLAGDAGATEQLKALAADATYDPLVCAPVYAQVLTGEERANYLLHKSPDATGNHRDDEAMIRTLLWLGGLEDPRLASTTMTNSALVGEDALSQAGFLLGAATEVWRGKKAANFILALEGDVLLAVQRGDFEAARKLVGEGLAAAQQSDESDARFFASQLASAVVLRAGDTPVPSIDGDLPDGLRVRRGEDPRYEMAGYPQVCADLFVQARLAAQKGDGRALATAMQSCQVYWEFSPQILLGLLPLLKEGRAEVATALRWWSNTSSGQHEPFTSALRSSLRRDLARLAGDNESADRWGKVAAAYAQPLQDPVKRAALVLWAQ